MNIQEQIDSSIQRIEQKQEEIANKVEILEKRISVFNIWAWIFVAIGLITAVIATIYFFYVKKNGDFELNLLGDFLSGSVGAIWSLAGLFFIYVAFLGQKQQLLNQQLEIMYSQLEVKNTRLELAGQKEEMRIQNSTLKLQKFENTFFNLLTLLSSIVTTIDIRNIRTQIVISSGRDCFKIFYDELITIVNKDNEEESEEIFNIEEISLEDTIKSYDKLYNNNKSDLSHYMRSVYHIIKFIDKSDIDDKKQYIGLLRAQISSYEQIIIFYNCSHIHGQKFKLLANKYDFFKNIDNNLFLNLEHSKEIETSEI
ncbi:putative phage abortive infection protein [Flavobacterium magnesitis]|uniref:putative phage abortive infection protein n=1 Tax=Flavobacterium magnesitis TaxID=3138077 RepID=UPI0035902A55